MFIITKTIRESTSVRIKELQTGNKYTKIINRAITTR